MSINTEYEVKTDCMFYEHKRKDCMALKALFCQAENCKFYTTKEVNNDKKNKNF